MNFGTFWVCISAFILFAAHSSYAADGAKLQRVGFIVPLTGPVASAGQSLHKAALLAASHNLELHFEDDQCNAGKALSAYRLLKTRGIRVFFVACSGSILALAAEAKVAGDLLVTAHSGSPEIRKTGLEVIRFNPDGISIAEAMIAEAQKRPGPFVLLTEQNDYAQIAGKMLEEKLGSRILFSDSYNPNDATFKDLLTRLRSYRASDLIWIPVSDVAAKIILREMKLLHLTFSIIGEDNLCDYPFSPRDFGFSGRCLKAYLDTESFHDFEKDFLKHYGEKSNYPYYDALTFDILAILNELAKTTSFTTNEGVAALKNKIIAGVTGPIQSYHFDPMGEVVAGDYITVREF